ncbi:MAG TPA: DUF5060 domain-containing protein [Candidatus Binatia bacterium]|nr:DUF5060 domain-containing protein [Candidatus Binatia bacterium]
MFAVSARADVYPKIEASFNLAGLATDPFDYTQTDVRVQIAQPDGTTNTLLAFFDGGTTWRVRHTPTLAGIYQVAGVNMNGLPITVANLQPASWTVAGTPTSPGYVRVDPANTNRFITSNGRRHFPLGHDVAWWTNNTQLPTIFAKLGGARENWSRVWMMNFYDSLNLEWPKVGTFGTFSLPVAQKWDAIVSAAEQAGIFFQVTLQHHGQYASIPGSNVNPQWEQNPYNSANGGFLTNATQFFTNAQAGALTKRKFRYIVARWGYSPAIMGWELFNEVQFTDAAYANQWTNIAAWHDEMAQFIRSQDVYQHLITTSSQLNQQIWNQCDYYQHHDYPSDLISGLQGAPGVPAGQPVKPIFSGECGSNGVPFLGFHAPIWAGLMGAQSGAAQQWYGDGLEADNAYGLFHAGRDFVLYSGLADQQTLTRSAPHVTCAQGTALVFAPGGGYADATQDTFTVGDTAPSGIGTLPSFLQGNFHRSMTPNGFTFLVNYPTNGTFSVQVLIIAKSGASLTIYLDGGVANSISFPTNTADVNTNYTLSVSVPAGPHTVKLYNPGQDWVNLGNLTLNPYASMLGAYQIGNSNFATLWLWHRTNIYYPNATATLGGTVPLGGLQPGTYAATWWDTFAGAALSNFTFSVADTNPVTLTVPPLLRSVAFFTGQPAQAGLFAPALTQALGSNSPALSLPLLITNSGGLPLAYSLSVTGANSVIYSAMNSSQLGGPVFAWRDISGIGRDLTTNFTALTVKNAKDEGIAGPIDIGFSFPFFSGAQSPGLYTQLYVSPNGFVSFNPFAGDTSTNRTLPNSLAPSNCIAFFWNDLDLSTAGKIFCATDSITGTFTLQFQKAPIKGTATNVTCQLILKTTGEILMQYQTVGISNACTVGLQNAVGNQGLQVAYNQGYLQSGFAVRLSPTPWLSLSANAALVPRSNSEVVNLSLNPSRLSNGTYTATLLVQTADPALSLTVLPVTLYVALPIDQWRFANFGTIGNTGNAADGADPDHDGLLNIFEYAFNTNPNIPNPSPITNAVTNNHLTVTFKRTHPAPTDISYLFDVTDNPGSGVWQSGPAFTTLTAVDNHDGTETVTVTDNTLVPSSAAHYLRIRISRP